MTRRKVSLEHLTKNADEWKEAILVFTEDSFEKEYTLESRSYQIFSDAKYFTSGMISDSLHGNCLDGTDQGVRLDHLLHEGWKVEYAYIVE